MLEETKLKGEDISFALTMTVGNKAPVIHQFNGRVRGDVIEGTVSVTYKLDDRPFVLPWRAVRANETTYFSPTGTTLD